MGASGSIHTNSKLVYVSFDKTCSDKIKNICVSKLSEHDYTIKNSDTSRDESYDEEYKKNIIESSNYILIFISKDTLQSSNQAYDIDISLKKKKSIIYLITDYDFIPEKNSGIKSFIGLSKWLPCYDKSSVNSSFENIISMLE